MHNLALCITNRCPLRCSFCCVPPGPGDLDEAIIDRVVADVVSERQKWRSVGFTGGEPLVRVDTVCRAGTTLAKNGIPWGVTTGLGWCSSHDRALKVATRLLNARMTTLNVSIDPSHFEHLKNSAYRSFLREMALGELRLTISCTLFEGQEMSDEDITAMTGLKGAGVTIQRHYVAKVGFARERNDCSSSKFNFAESRCPMRNELTLSIWPDGAVYPCCSTYVVNKEKNLIVGNVHSQSINRIADDAERDAFLSFIRRAGFSSLIAGFGDELGEIERVFQDYPQDTCHLCAKISSTVDLKKLRHAIVKKGFQVANGREATSFNPPLGASSRPEQLDRMVWHERTEPLGEPSDSGAVSVTTIKMAEPDFTQAF